MTDDTAKKNVIGLRRVLRAKAEEQARGVVTSNPSREQRLSDQIMAAAEAAGARVVTLTNIKDHPDIVMMSPPNSAEARAAFAAAPNTGPSAAELWAHRHLGQPYQPLGQPPIPTPEQLRAAIAKHERTPRDAFDVFLACADAETVYDFSSETEMRGDSFVITVTATPRRGGPAPAEGG